MTLSDRTDAPPTSDPGSQFTDRRLGAMIPTLPAASHTVEEEITS